MKIFKKVGIMAFSAALVFSSIGQGQVSYATSEPEQGQKSYAETLNRLGFKSSSSLQSLPTSKDDEDVFYDNLLVIKYKKGISTSTHKKMGTTLVKKVSDLQYDVVQVTNKKNLEKVAAEYMKRDDVLSVTKSAKVSKLGLPDQKRSSMYHLDNLKIDDAAKLAGKNKVKVAVVDTGIDPNHPELKNKIVYNYNVMDPLKKGAADLHGTHVAGIIAAEKNNEVGGYGVNPNVQIVSIDVFNRSFSSSDYTVAEGILEAIKQKVQVINLSLGSTFASPIIKEAIDKAIEANITVVAAAGNSGSEMLEYPASFNGVISVGATNKENKLAEFSTYGPSVDVVAPGEDIYSSTYEAERGSSFAKLDGTSMASPVVAGTVSLLLSKNPKLTPQQVQYILNKTATDLGSKGYDTTYGFGLVNPVNALKYDAKKLPVVEKLKENQLIEKAKKIEVTENSVQKGAITKLYQTDWYQFSVSENEYVQLNLLPSRKSYDYKYDIYFFPEGETEAAAEHVTVNDVTVGGEEASLYKAPQAGTVVIGVSDALKKYVESAKQTYTLTASKTAELQDDGLTEENMQTVSQFPFRSDALFFTEAAPPVSEEETPVEEEQPIDDLTFGDSDFFTFTVPAGESTETYQVSSTGVPGIDETINLYMVEKYEMDGEVFEERVQYDSVNNNSYGKGETISFNGSPGETFVIEVTNNPLSEEIFMWLDMGQELDLNRSFSSTIPYKVTIDKTVLSADEDQFPEASYDYSDEVTEEYVEQAVKTKENIRNGILEDLLALLGEEEDYYSLVPEIAMPYTVNEDAKGFFQYSGDEDWYAVQLDKTGVYELSNQGVQSGIEVYQQNAETGDFSMIASNLYFDMAGESVLEKMYVGLKEDQTYYIKVADPMYRPNLNEYSFTAKFVTDAPLDSQESNDVYSDATELKEGKITGNFSTEQDMDILYYKPTKSGIYGYQIQPVDTKYDSKVPKELKRELDPVVLLIEDTDGDKELDVEEEGKLIITDVGLSGDEERGSFNASKGKGYFVVLVDYYGTASLQNYTFTFASGNRVDEDKGSVIKNNVPSKSISLKSDKKGKLTGSGYMNASNQKGDVDYFKLVIKDKSKKYKVKLDVPSDLDGVVSLYEAKGKQLLKKDVYGLGDSEEFYVNLKKGTYFFKVEDKNGTASISPYQLTLQ
ncbi:S8 family peptidase [Metabacillus halosaccharovorans]|uniref:S8 family peptidase n=1 Tax=Metabacillus halosaccharovorans TaxID=930124 RepID=UPI001475187D|nr:S8 family peptidase [Metabacillus halosaccharovorans]